MSVEVTEIIKRIEIRAGASGQGVDLIYNQGTGEFQLAGTAPVTAILDEDNLVSDRDDALATQQSIKAYVDSATAGITQTFEDLTDTNFTGLVDLQFARYDSGTSKWINITLTASEIKSLYESNADTNAFTDALLSKLNGIEAGATGDQTGAEIKALYEAEPDTNAFTDTDESKLDGIAAGAEVNVNADWNAVSGDAEILNKPSDLTDLSTHSVTELNDVTDAGSGIIISGVERTTLGTALQPADILNVLTSTDTTKALSAAQGKVLKDLIDALSGSLVPQGNWDANTNTPDITGTTETGYYWIVSVAGSTSLGGITDWEINDWAIKTSTGWAKIDNTDKVDSVNSQTGTVVLDADDISDTATTNKFATSAQLAKVDFITITQAVDLDDVESKANSALQSGANHSVLTLDDGTNPHGTTKADVGLGNADNTSDLNKPISTATQTALDLKADDADLTSHTGDATIHFTEASIDHTAIQNVGTNTHAQIDTHIADVANPHSVTATQVGLGNVDNTSDIDKPVSTAQQTALDLKADKSNVLELDNTSPFAPDADYEPATKLYTDTTANTAAEAFSNGLLANITANGGVNGGNLGLTTQIVLKTTEGKIQLGSADDGNEVTIYASGADFTAVPPVVKTRVFLKKGEVYVETGVSDGAIITSTKGVCGASGNEDSGNQSPMPLGVEGFADRQFFLFAHRNADGTGSAIGEVYVAAGAVAADVQLLNGAGDTVIDSASIDAFGLATLLTNANAEFQVVATQPVFVGFAAQMGGPTFYDMRLVPPLSTDLIGHARNCRMSSLYDNTEVYMYAQNGDVGLITLSPGAPIRIDNGIINELGDVFFIESNATPATAGTFNISLTTPTELALTRVSPNNTDNSFDVVLDGNNRIVACVFTTPSSAPTTNPDVLWETGGATGSGVYLNTSNQLDIYINNSSSFVTTSALATNTQYGLIVEFDTTNSIVNIHLVAGSDLSFWSVGRTPEYTLVPPNSDYSGTDNAGYGVVNGTAGGYAGTANSWAGSLDSDLVIQSNTDPIVFLSLNVTTGNIAFDATPQDIKDALLGIAGAGSGTGDSIVATVGVSPVVVTSVAHGLSTGDHVQVTSSAFPTQLALGHYSEINVVNVDTFEIDFYPTGGGGGTIDWYQTVYGEDDFKVESVLKANLSESSAKFVIFCKGQFIRFASSPSLITTGLTGNAHTLTVYQAGNTVDAMPTPTDYNKTGIVRAIASGPTSGFSGADGAGLEATPWYPTSALTQRIPIPLAFEGGGGNGDNRSIAIQSPYKGSAKLFRDNGDLLATYNFDRDASLSSPDSSFEQRFPTGITVSGNASGAGIDQAFTGDWLGGYIEADVPINIILNTNQNQNLIQQGISTSADEILCFGVTPEDCRAEIRCTGDGRFRKRVIDSTGSENWELV